MFKKFSTGCEKLWGKLLKYCYRNKKKSAYLPFSTKLVKRRKRQIMQGKTEKFKDGNFLKIKVDVNFSKERVKQLLSC